MTEREEQAVIVLNTLYNNPLLSDIHKQALEVGIMAIKAASSSEKQKMGHWVYDKERDSYKCSLCGFFCAEDKLGAIPTKYCAGCGEKMQEV